MQGEINKKQTSEEKSKKQKKEQDRKVREIVKKCQKMSAPTQGAF